MFSRHGGVAGEGDSKRAIRKDGETLRSLVCGAKAWPVPSVGALRAGRVRVGRGRARERWFLLEISFQIFYSSGCKRACFDWTG